MCGIAGYFGLESDHGLLERMGTAQRHRGPDDQGTFVDGPVGLAHQRLSIIDREGGHQPMATPDGGYVLAYNGEVYNYRALRTELEALGHAFVTHSDTEVVLEAFAEWGAESFDRLNGMFAIAVWDRDEQTLTLARDQFGIKPVHLTRVTDPHGRGEGEAWLFSSEIKAILASGRHEPAPNERIIYRYLRHRVHDDGVETFFDGIERLLPGEMATISSRGLERRQYSTLQQDLMSATPPPTGAGPDTVAAFREGLAESIALRLRSDVPVGTSLSGGLDSSAIAVGIDRMLTAHDASAEAVGHRQQTFSAVFTGYRNDEERWVDDAVAACHGAVESHRIRPTSAEMLEDLTDFVRTQEEPTVSTGPYAQYRVMQEASKHVTVMLDGQGADEMLAGYVPQTVSHLRSLMARDRRAGIKEVVASRDVLSTVVRARLRTRLQGGGSFGELLSRDFKAAHADDSYTVGGGANLRQRLVHDLFVASLPALLRYEDRNSMRFSVEGRVPFLDPNLVRAVFAMPDDAVIKDGWNKAVLRDAEEGILPASIVRRRNKIGFTSPQNDWFREQKEFIYQVFLSESFASRPYFNRTEVLNAFELWLSDSGSLDSMAFWRILNVELWLREFIDPKPSAETEQPQAVESAEPVAAVAGPVTNEGKSLDLVLPDRSTVRRHPVRTPLVTASDDLTKLVVDHVTDHLEVLGDGRTVSGSAFDRWYVFVSEKVVATTQRRSFYVWDIPVTRSARLLSRHVTRTPAGIGLGSPFTMQLAIDEVGLPRVLVAAAAGGVGRLVGRRGVFYTVAGGDVRAIDGPTEYSVAPANMSAKLGPKDPSAVAATLSAAIRSALPEGLAATFAGTVVVDANDLGCNVLGTDASTPVERLERMFADNPLGQGSQQTPLAVVLDSVRSEADPSTTGPSHAGRATGGQA
ncbi:asparagine synthase (glutamine-hydrolyzing) [Terrabacter aerolatus]|uniref:asparagine synthase (glutamine-hydrolyzing) n=1 Tax=Terrabacter aerolatus TaxID=422442 RepID=UPI0027D932AA|nr:asparagine synthase (glutamine-hydrolyzing) [Terrabacter aerolatus]